MLISVHIPKTGGVTLRALWQRTFGPNVYFDYGSQYAFTDPVPPTPGVRARRLARQLRRWRRLRPTDRCIHGHFRAGRYEAHFPGAPVVTWLRDPVERVASHYYFWQRYPDRAHGVCRQVLRERLSLEEFAEIPAMRDLQSRYCDGWPLARFAFVGVVERFHELAPRLLLLAGAGPTPLPPPANVGTARAPGARYVLPPSTRNHLERMNANDRELYEQALAYWRQEGLC